MKKIAIFGAHSAIAVACARRFAATGAEIFLVARNGEKLAQVSADLKARGAAQIYEYGADLSDCARHQEVFSAAEKALGNIELVLLAYGVLGSQAEAQDSFAATDEVLLVNLRSPISLLSIIANRFEALRAGKIAVISSVAGDRGRQSNYVYGASKGGLNVFLEGLRNRLYPSGVHVLTIKPGFVDTPMTAHIEKKPFVVKPEVIARDVQRALDWNLNTVYTPCIWWPIMFIIRHIPEFIFKRLKL